MNNFEANPTNIEPSTTDKSSHLISDPKVRQERAAEKRRSTLRLLRDEIWTATEVVAVLLGVKYSAANALLKMMQRDGLLVSTNLFIPSQRGAKQVVLYGITAKGLAYAWSIDETPESRAPWEPSKTNALFVPHQIKTQLARVKAEQMGWRDWKPTRLLMKLGLPKLPDGEAVNLIDEHIAIEVENEIKTDKRLEAVVGAYIAEIKNKRWDRVDYLCPDEDFAARLARNFGRLKQLRLESNGKQPSITGKLEQAHLDRFRFYSSDQWPSGNFVVARKV